MIIVMVIELQVVIVIVFVVIVVLQVVMVLVVVVVVLQRVTKSDNNVSNKIVFLIIMRWKKSQFKKSKTHKP